MKEDPKYKDMDITYLVVIEGMASKDNYYDNDSKMTFYEARTE